MDEHYERQLRRQAIRRLCRGESPSLIARGLGRTRRWVHKWWQRFFHQGWTGLASRSRQPHRYSNRSSPSVRRYVVRARRRLERSPVGLIGPNWVRRQLQQWRVHPLPSRATIARILHQRGLTLGSATPPQSQAYYPHPRSATHFRLHAMDWTCRYLPGGKKAFAFHTVDYASRNLHQDIFGDKTAQSACVHALSVWRGPLGLPDALQLDNDIAFVGGHHGQRVLGQFLRLCLAVGVEPIFLPFCEPQRNELVEELNGLWQWALWRHRRFHSLTKVQRTQSLFLHWYRYHYLPPTLHGQTPVQASRRQPVVRLTTLQRWQLPEPLPITAGRVHFIRLVDAHGEIRILNETWLVGQRWVGKYVWVTLSTQRRRLDVYQRPSAMHRVRRIRSWSYSLAEHVVALAPEFRRRLRRRKVGTMF
jgi:putative transposase